MPDFVIPVARSDLLKRATPNAFVVNEVLPVRYLRSHLQKCLRSLSTEGHVYILRSFDGLFSVLHEWANVSTDIKEEAWGVVLRGCEVCVRQLASVLESGGSCNSGLNRTEMVVHRNSLKMHIYLLCQFVDMFENELNAQAKSTAAVKVGRGRGAGASGRGGRGRNVEGTGTMSANLTLSMDWIEECEKAVCVLDQACRLQVNKLWDPPVAEEDFVNLIANCVYKLLENRSMASSVNVRTAMTSLLASLIRRYGHSIACCVKLTQLLQCFSHMVNCLLSFVRSFMEEENLSGVVRELLKEICSYSGADLERDAQATQNFSSFLLEIAAAYPHLGQSILPLLRPRLDEDPYQIRNCVLGVIGEVLPVFARREQLDPKESVQRDRLMDLLQEHVHDVNGYVRAKALQIWYSIVSTRGLPVRRQSQLAALLVGPQGAMMDVSSFARRYACKTLTAMVLQSPAAKLTPEELRHVLNKEVKRLESLEELLVSILIRGVFSAAGKVCPYDEDEADLAAADGNLQSGVIRDETNAKAKHKQKQKKGKHKQKRSTVDKDHEADPSRSADSEEESDGTDIDQSNESGYSETESNEEENDNQSTTEPQSSMIDSAAPDVMAALEAAIHTAAEVASQTPSSVAARSPLRSTTVAHAELSASVMRQRACVAYLRETSAFASLIGMAIRDFQNMLASKTLSDVTEAIEFFVSAKHAGVAGLGSGIQQIFVQIWSQEETIRKAVVEAFRKLYLQLDPDEPIGPNDALTSETADIIASNLSQFIHTADVGSLVSMERIIQHLIQTDQMNHQLNAHLWRRFIQSASQSSKQNMEDAKSMLLTLKMMVKSDPKEFDKHLDALIHYGLQSSIEASKVDLHRVKFTCEVLLRMVPRAKADKASGRPKGSPEPFRFPVNHTLFSRLRSIMVSNIGVPDQTMWIPMMEQATGIIYDLAESPESILTNVISMCAEKVALFCRQHSGLSQEPPLTGEANAVGTVDGGPNADQENLPPLSQFKHDPERFLESITISCPAFILSRFLALAGHMCLKQLVHLESSVFHELKRRALLKEEREAKVKPKSRKHQRQSKTSTSSFTNNSTLITNNSTGQQTADEECGLVGVNADDAEADYVRHICDHELISEPNHLFSPLLTIVTHVCSNPIRFTDESVQAAASLALAKMMLVNAEVCEPRLQLLFTMAERSQSEIVRANLIVALGDLCRRFPNLIEPWTPNLYARLRDSSARVRTNALNTLSHLILNDMVKVKGQISEMTVCLVDEIDRLHVLARQFFTELSHKGNALYNVIPDIISRLSDPDVGVSEEHFHSIMDFLIPLIGRERLCETLVEKICSRFRTTSLQRQWRDLSHCLTVMSFNERMMRVLYENIAAFADKLFVPEVYSAFELLISNAKKSTKPDGMARLEEFEAKVNEFHQKGVSDEAAVRRAELAAKALKQKSRQRSSVGSTVGEQTRRNLRRGTRSTNVIETTAPEDEEDHPEEPGPSQIVAAAGRQKVVNVRRGQGRQVTRAQRQRVRAAFSSDEEEDAESSGSTSD
ncbi:Condensin complex subunit 1 [Fasciola hepatica]|uniref:Condensin complex subunit 1 n=1 Tax=Fasciola hepatica TaxID=6192 RepID=A0A4E0RHK0_FASHE|nr:Condensin complex subunit 1 [Fasciola hepatica]